MRKFLAFTLTELMIALAVLGILCAIVLPAITNNSPNQNKMMMKKSYYTFGEVIQDLINNPDYYPMTDGYCTDKSSSGYIGFDCGNAEKLPYLFAKELNLSERMTLSQASFAGTSSPYKKTTCYGAGKSALATNCYVLTTSDGISWAFPDNSFVKNAPTDYIDIGIDVNGDKKPNCYQGSTTGTCKGKTKNFDQYRIRLYTDGVFEIKSTDTWAKSAININSAISED